MPYFVYILYSLKDEKLYVGCTEDLEQRLKRHNSGFVTATRDRRPLELIYSEKFNDKTEAFNRERFFKSLWSGRLKKKILKEYKQSRVCQKHNG
jgi:putative endonuclease